MNYENEIWKDIPKEEWNQYQVSNLGRIRHKENKKIRSLNSNGNGYLICGIRYKGKACNIYPHVAVALAFIPNDDPEHKTQVSHLDETRTNNFVENLCWVSAKENCNMPLHKKRLGKKVKCIETEQIFSSIKEAAEFIGIDRSNISAVCNGRRHTTGGYHFEFYYGGIDND